jgi:hypothetical protein
MNAMPSDYFQVLAQVQSGWFADMDPTNRFVITLIVIVGVVIALISIVAIVCAMAGTMHRERTEAELKREMLDRGLTAGEIAQVIESRTPENFLDRWASNRGKKEDKKSA